MIKIIVEDNLNPRLDQFVTTNSEYTRSVAQKMIKDGKVLVNQKISKASNRLQIGDVVEIEEHFFNEEIDLTPINMNLDIIFEDDDVIVINKPKGLVVHPGAGNHEQTLVHGLLYHCKNLSDVNDEVRPGIVHRIDKDTSGLIVCAKNNNAHLKIAKQLEDKTCFRKYYALVNGHIQVPSGKIDAPINRSKKDRQKMEVNHEGKHAVTNFKVLETYKDSSLIDVELETGRTHQIRVHMAWIKHPVINDSKYGRKTIDETGQYLHAYYLSFIHPNTNKRVEFQINMPDYMTKYINERKNNV